MLSILNKKSNNSETMQSELTTDNESKLNNVVKSIIPKMRFGFAAACENSHVVCFVEGLYASFLSCKTRVLGVFFLAFSLLSLLIKYFSFKKLPMKLKFLLKLTYEL